MTTQEALWCLVALLPVCVYAAYVRGSTTRKMRARRELLRALAPYIKRRRRDMPGEALKRAAYCAWVDKKITRAQMELFR